MKHAFCSDDALGYECSRTQFRAAEPLRLDPLYRLAHLPLVNPDHSDVIASVAGKDYMMGRHSPVQSLVLPIPPRELEASSAYQQLLSELGQTSFGHKIAWDIVGKRRNLLHATLCGSLGQGIEQPALNPDLHTRLRNLGPFQVELRGLFSGNINIGRLYLKAYPASRTGEQAFHQIQKVMNRSLTDLYLVGLFNLTDHLTANEATALDHIINHWWDRTILMFEAQELWLISSRDDLVLDSQILQKISLKQRN